MLKTTYAQDVVNDFLFMKNHINEICELKLDILEFLKMNSFTENEINQDGLYNVYIHEPSKLVIDIHKSIILKDRFIVMSCFGGEWQKVFQPNEVNDLKNAIIEIIAIQTI